MDLCEVKTSLVYRVSPRIRKKTPVLGESDNLTQTYIYRQNTNAHNIKINNFFKKR